MYPVYINKHTKQTARLIDKLTNGLYLMKFNDGTSLWVMKSHIDQDFKPIFMSGESTCSEIGGLYRHYWLNPKVAKFR